MEEYNERQLIELLRQIAESLKAVNTNLTALCSILDRK